MSLTNEKIKAVDNRIKCLFGGHFREETQKNEMASIPTTIEQLSAVFWGKEEYFVEIDPTLNLSNDQHTKLTRLVITKQPEIHCAIGRHTVYDDHRTIAHEWIFKLKTCNIKNGHNTIGIIDENDISNRKKFATGSTNHYSLCLDNIDGKVQCKFKAKYHQRWKLKKTIELKDVEKITMFLWGDLLQFRDGKQNIICNWFIKRTNIKYRMFCTIGAKATQDGMIQIEKYNGNAAIDYPF